MQGFPEILRLFLDVLRILVQRVVMMGKVGKVGLQETKDLGTRTRFEMFAPVVGFQAVIAGEFLGIKHDAGEATGHVYLNDAHLELRRDPVERIALDECVVRSRGIAVAAFFEIKLAEIAVNAILIIALAMCIKIFHYGFRTVQIRKAQADDTEGVIHTLAGKIVLGLGEIVPFGHLVIQQRNEARQCVFIKFLLVIGPTELV